MSSFLAETSDTLPYMTTLIRTTADTLPEILRATRGAAGYSARALGLIVGVSHGTVSAWERGATEPTVSQFIAWADATGQQPEQLIAALRESRRADLAG